MSNALAIAAVTAVLRDLLDSALVERGISAIVGGQVTVSAVPPDRIRSGNGEPTRLNVFLYHIAPNPGWRNDSLPSVGPRGERASNPYLALDLFYLISAYAADDFEAELLLGCALQRLHETPVLTRDAIRRALTPPGGGNVPPVRVALAGTELAEQAELIKLTMQPMGTEEVSKLWAAIQSNYRPSVAYQASVVLIESQRSSRSPLPVLRRGAGDQGVAVQPDTTPPEPPFATLSTISAPNGQPSARLGDRLTLTGFHLDGSSVEVRFASPRLSAPIAVPAEPGGTAEQITVQVPSAPASWVAGVYSVTVAVSRPGEPVQVTNALALPLAPVILTVSPDPAARDGNGRVTLTVTCSPRVRPEQRASLFVGAREVLAQPHPAATDTLTFRVDTAPPGQHWLRLRVDGVDSLLVDRSVTPPVFDPSQRVTIT